MGWRHRHLLLSAMVPASRRQCAGRFLYPKDRPAREPPARALGYKHLLIAALLLWRMWHGAGEMRSYGEQTAGPAPADLDQLCGHSADHGAFGCDLCRDYDRASENGPFGMSGIAAGLTGFAVLLALMAIRIPIGVAMLAVGVRGYGLLYRDGALARLSENIDLLPVFDPIRCPGHSAFVLMGEFATKAGMSRALIAPPPPFWGIAGRVGLGIHWRLRGIRGDLRIVPGHRRHHGRGRAAGNAAL